MGSTMMSWLAILMLIGHHRSQTFYFRLYLPDRWWINLLELSETEHCSSVINWSWIHSPNSCFHRSIVASTYHCWSIPTIGTPGTSTFWQSICHCNCLWQSVTCQDKTLWHQTLFYQEHNWRWQDFNQIFANWTNGCRYFHKGLTRF